MILFANDSGLAFRNKDVNELEISWIEILSSCVAGLLTTNWAFNFEILYFFTSKHEIKRAGCLKTCNNGISIKQIFKVSYLGCDLDENRSVNSWP